MSLHPKSEKTDAQLRGAGGRSSGGGHQQPPRGGSGVGGHGPHNSSNSSGKRSNGPGGQSRVNPNAGSLQSNASVKVQNGSHTQRQQAGQATSASSGNVPLPATKQSNVVPPKSNGILPKPPMSQLSNIKSSEQTSSVTATAISGESNTAVLQQPIAFQFGSFSPVSINGFQIPARTSSAPPNFDEQKRDQARSGATTDLPHLSSALSGTSQRQETHPSSKQVSSTLNHPSEGKRTLAGTKAGVSVVQIQEIPGGRKPSGLVFQSINPSISQGVGVVPGSLAASPYMQSQNVSSGSRAPNSQHLSQGLASQLHVQSSQLPLQVSAPGLHAHNSKVQPQSAVPSSQLHSQGNAGIHVPSSQLQSQVATAGSYVPNSQLQSQAGAPGWPLQVPMQMPQVQQVFGSQGRPTGALPSQGMLHHGLSFPQPIRHMMQQVNTHLTIQQFLPGNPQINAQIPIQLNPQLNIPAYVSSPQTNQYNIPHLTRTFKITHPETHEELTFGPKGAKSESHVDNGVVTLVSDSNSLPGILPPQGPAHSSSIPVSGVHAKNFYPSASAASYGHSSFQQPSKATTTVRPSIVRPSTGQNLAAVNHSGTKVDLSKQFSISKSTNAGDVPKAVNKKKKKKQLLSNENAATPAGDVPKAVNKKKKKKEFLSKADAAAPAGDLYNAYKVTEKQEDVNDLEPSNVVTAVEEIPPLKETEKQIQKEVDDWKYGAGLSTNVKQETASIDESDRSRGRRYSRDFLMAFRAQSKDLPLNFEIRQDIKDIMENQSIATQHGDGELLANMGRVVDGNSRLADKWTKPMDAFTGVTDMRMEIGVGCSVGFRPSQGYNTGVGKNMRGRGNLTGILGSGPFGQTHYPHGGLMRKNSKVQSQSTDKKETEKKVQKEVDEWEDVAELSTNVKQVTPSIDESDTSGVRSYLRDFLLTFRAQFKDLPPNFEIPQDIKDVMENQSIATQHGEGELWANTGRVVNGNSRLEDKWTRPVDAFTGGRDIRMDMGASWPGGFRPNQGYNTGFGKHMRGPGNLTGILPSGTFEQAPYPQEGLMRSISDVDGWQHGSAFQKVLIPPSPDPSRVIHKIENRYEVHKVSDEEELKQRQIKAILNKLTPQNFKELFLKVKEVSIDSVVFLTGVISQIFDKALMEPTFCEMYAKLCARLAAGLPDFYEDNKKVMFMRKLLNKCQEEFERDERELDEAQNAEDGEIKFSKEEIEEKRFAIRKRMLGNIRFIGELYKESMLTERIMHEFIKELLGEYQNPNEQNVEALCILMSTIGHLIDHLKVKDHIDTYFERITRMASNQVLPSRLRFMLKDVIDLRKNGWQQRTKVDGPKKIEEVHRDRGSRGPPMQPFMAGAAGSVSPPSPVIHQTNNYYEVRKVSDEEEWKQRQIKAILNKLTPQNFERLFLKVKEVNIHSVVLLSGVISQIFDRALVEPKFCEMYAKFCVRLAAGLPEFYEDNKIFIFRQELLNKCQEEFERDEREQAEAQNAEDGEIKFSKEEIKEKRVTMQRRMLGNIRFMGELFKESMLTERMMHECIQKLLGGYQNPDEENVEALCALMTTIGHLIDNSKAKDHIDAYFEIITRMTSNQVLSSRLRFMLKDIIDLRKNGWQQRIKVDGPKKIEEVHSNAAQERQAAAIACQLTQAPSMGHTGWRVSTPPDHGSRGPQMQPFMVGVAGSMSHMIGTRGSLAGGRGFILQDARVEDSIMPFPQRI